MHCRTLMKGTKIEVEARCSFVEGAWGVQLWMQCSNILEFGHLIRTKQISAEELTGIFLKRLKRCYSNMGVHGLIIYHVESHSQ
ncbi:hypothetical protein Tco_1359231, partial [Tanacetum coccineum]